VPTDDDPAAGVVPPVEDWLRGAGAVVTSPARRALVPGADVDPRLRPWDLGCWAGQELAALPPADLAAWRADPDWAGHGGESLRAVAARVSALLAQWHGRQGRLVAVTHASVVRAAVLLALRAPMEAAWELDVRPGSRTQLHADRGRWRVVSVGCSP
jgi:broad specificity phosphatase PhoE